MMPSIRMPCIAQPWQSSLFARMITWWAYGGVPMLHWSQLPALSPSLRSPLWLGE
ncbi:Hypothetical protein FKW44_011548 [Caligus rogercresseyi]|uniref:Uncharacterized protein n=1 Tax=Caligus rogercresseyi TaxID=217165 RepID=A0A7T8HI56_CALRO|nr:Hypothetical protein FKW44_011548 [Caligus rogercresseyi]